ncbi:MAG: bifunctional phosphopantothenoylcysteine decarboxylase/phosphopantothenate--cysteine ligase CoaBC [Proteobacteria bacterium]|nr:bifunctional phosphopantothenoylcysteine decarboxylase/phosphopantothenate--cysteine ligase CoaBC [Pseudomonadota bacterium]MBU1709222.1 bifunctional phosphopantothenoylcysteine decarboxylase/phosphopantothenate--cysteine ligase CoaBC [Pseudomonadota bacterium]
MLLTDKKILLGITGSIAAYKACDLLRNLRREGAIVTVVMTDSATKFVSPLTFAALSGNAVHTRMFDESSPEKIPHINLARNNDLILVAPATAQTIARLANGMADDLLSTVILAADSKVLVCPAMNTKMYMHPATRKNIKRLKKFGYHVLEPDSGSMACGEEGPGRMPEWPMIRHAVFSALIPQDLHSQKVLVTAGPTQEAFDPARFISNRSSGKMGYAMAQSAAMRGAEVTLISGPSSLPHPPGVTVVSVTTAYEMYTAVMERVEKATVIVKAAAVSDFSPKELSPTKIKKTKHTLSIELNENKDILFELGKLKEKKKTFPLLIGFAAESNNHLTHGKMKLDRKNLDYIVINDITAKDSGFAVDTNKVTLMDAHGTKENYPLLSKEETAHRIWDRIAADCFTDS